MLQQMKQKSEQIFTRMETIKQEVIHLENQIRAYEQQKSQLTNEWVRLSGSLNELQLWISEMEKEVKDEKEISKTEDKEAR